MTGLDQVAAGEVLDTLDIDAMPTRCSHTTRVSGINVRCDLMTGHHGPHRVTTTFTIGDVL